MSTLVLVIEIQLWQSPSFRRCEPLADLIERLLHVSRKRKLEKKSDIRNKTYESQGWTTSCVEREACRGELQRRCGFPSRLGKLE